MNQLVSYFKVPSQRTTYGLANCLFSINYYDFIHMVFKLRNADFGIKYDKNGKE